VHQLHAYNGFVSSSSHLDGFSPHQLPDAGFFFALPGKRCLAGDQVGSQNKVVTFAQPSIVEANPRLAVINYVHRQR
jgi:hypothetical protein